MIISLPPPTDRERQTHSGKWGFADPAFQKWDRHVRTGAQRPAGSAARSAFRRVAAPCGDDDLRSKRPSPKEKRRFFGALRAMSATGR